MKIKKMTATFGALDGAVLTPGEGLTVITAPNEAGKSTWAGFLKAMLYGIDTRERDKAGFLADKNRYLPWSGAPMAGELQVQWQGKDITIRRFGAKNNPFGGFEAVYTASGDPVPGLTAANVGAALTGVSRDVYLRSAFVGQSGTAVTPNSELEARVSALATSGEEDVSYTAVERTLKDWRNRRRANRSNGLLPELEAEIFETECALREVSALREKQEEGERTLRALSRRRDELRADAACWARIAAHEKNRRYAQAVEQQARAQAALDALTPPDPEIADWTAQEIRDWAAHGEAEYHAAQEARKQAQAQRAEILKKSGTPALLLMILAALLATVGLGLTITGGLGLHTIDPTFCYVLILGGFGIYLARSQLLRQAIRNADAVEIPDEPQPDNWQEQAQAHVDYLARKERLELELEHCRERADDLKAQGGQLCDTLELLQPPARSREACDAGLAEAEGQLISLRGQLERWAGAAQQMGDPDALQARLEQLRALQAQRMEEYDALTLAMDALGDANAILRERFSPALNKEAGRLFSALTGGRWPEVSLARDFTAQVTEAGGMIPRSCLALSAGTADQLYLAVRLALCQLTLPDAPILLDDALTAFDDARAALALSLLEELGRERQILLFSCHSREKLWAEARKIPVLSL